MTHSCLDLFDERCQLLVVGINPSPWNVKTGAPFSRPGNRFWPALAKAGITPVQIDASAGLSDEDRELILSSGLGISALVERATTTAAELTTKELRASPERVERIVAQIQPRVIAFAAITAYRTAYREPKVKVGKQDQTIGGAEVWLVPNPSGLNAHETVGSLAAAYAEAARAAGMALHPVT